MDAIAEERERLLPSEDTDRSYGASSNGNLQSPADDKDGIIIYTRRWYIVGVYSLLMFCLGAVCNSYGTIANASEKAFGWDDSDIALLSNWQPIAFVVFIGPFSWLMDVKGLRISCVLSSFMMALGTGLRCIARDPPLVNWLNHLGQILIGICSPVAYSGPSLLSSTWFPVEQRTTGTAISSIAYGFGPALVFVFGPLLVPVLGPSNSTDTNVTSTTSPTNETSVPDYIVSMREEIILFNIIQFALCALCFLMMLVYFPAKPPTPPSASAGVQRTNFRDGLRDVLRNQRFWILGFVYSATNGLYTTFAGLLDIDLKGAGIPDDQIVAGYMVLFSVIALTFVGIFVARIADVFLERIKPIMIGLCAASAVLLLWFTLIVEGILPPNLPCLYISYVLGAVTINAAVPLFYELACECTYPVAEGLTNGVLNLLNNVFSMFFLFALMIPNIGTSWMNWTMVAACAICVPILLPYKQRFGRRELDKDKEGESAGSEEPYDALDIHTPTRKVKLKSSKKVETRAARSKTISAKQQTPVTSRRSNRMIRSQSAPGDISDIIC